MPTPEQIETAHDAAWDAAMARAGDIPPTAKHLFDAAERAVIRTLLAARLLGGEVQYWKLVEQEVRRG